jgi:hypothetical protein
MVITSIVINMIGVWVIVDNGFFDNEPWANWFLIAFFGYVAIGAVYKIARYINGVVWITNDELYYAAWGDNNGIPISKITNVEVVDLSIRVEFETGAKTISRFLVSGKSVLLLLGRG